MTRIVVYDEELHEALTVVEISLSWPRAMENYFMPRQIRLPLPRAHISFDPVVDQPFMHEKYAYLRIEPVMRGRERVPIFWYAYAMNPEFALRLRAAFLPGQMAEVERVREAAYLEGAIAAMRL